MTLDDVKEEQYGQIIRLAILEEKDPLGDFFRDFGLGTSPAFAVKKATGVRALIMKSAVFICTGKWPKQVNLG